MTEGQPARPANIMEIVAINQGRSPLTMEEPEAPALGVEQFVALAAADHAVVDVRDPADFGAGHVPGAYNVKLGSAEFEQRVGWVIDPHTPTLLVLADDEDLTTALRKLAFVGLDARVRGYLEGGMGAWAKAGCEQQTLAQISVAELHEALGNGAAGAFEVLDVREPDEWQAGHVAGATSMSFKVLEKNLDELDLGRDDRVAVMCGAGIRSSTACSILLRNGFEDVHNVTGGMGAWRAAKLPTTEPEPA